MTALLAHYRIALFPFLLFTAILFSPVTKAAEPSLTLSFGTQTTQLTRAELLKLPTAKRISIANDIAYHTAMHYQAVPLATLIPNLSQLETVQFVSTDGFVANIPAAVLAGAGQPWLAIEAPDVAWPSLKSGKSAGPFYLVWLTPDKATISPEQWPYQVAKIIETEPLEKRYPQIVPKVDSKAAINGMHMYAIHCAACHQINGGGDAAIGPDLNKPFNPTEYFQDAFLRKLIRNPSLVRDWPQRTMGVFTTKDLSESQLDDLMVYLRQMAKQR
ncbi:MAG: cytochrome c [Glaciimonas sp.]|nr:cytochrome c [Glaciimonas sp.]